MNNEITFYDQNGSPVVYMELPNTTLYLYSGKPVGYIDNDAVFNFDGRQLGWYTNGWIRDLDGYCVFFTKNHKGLSPMTPMCLLSPLKSLKELPPLKAIQQLKVQKSLDSSEWSPLVGINFFI